MERATERIRLKHALGLSAKAGKLIRGTEMICDALKEKKKPFLVLCASDNSQNTQKRLSDRTAYYGVELLVLDLTGEELSQAIGKNNHVAAVAVTDENLSVLIKDTLQDHN